MCDYCGCRQQVAIEELSLEHERILDLGYDLRRSARRGDHAAALATIAELTPLLHDHTVKEERGLFTELRRAWEADDRLDTLVDEHRRFDDLLEDVRLGEAGWRRIIEVLVATLAEHIVSEETDLFPYSLYELEPEQWDAIDAVHAAGPSHPPAIRSTLRQAV